MDAHELYQAGQLNDAVAALINVVKKKPMDQESRALLCEFMIIQGQLERADKQLDLVAHQTPEQAMGVSLLRQLVRAEEVREQYFTQGRAPEVLAEPDALMQQYFQASISLREGNMEEAQKIFEQAEGQRKPAAGECNGQPFSDFRDLDDRTPAVFEVLTSTGKYYWVPFDLVSTITFHAPERPLDLLWRRATLESTIDHAEGDVYIPCTYFQKDESMITEAHRLGRETDWLGDEGEPILGLGQRLYLVGEEALSIMELEEISFNQ
ncbi:type VI secretion system accessory protein TagJ [Pseudomonadota bacterium]